MPPLPIAHAHYLLWVIFNHLPHNINLHLANSMSVRWAGMFAACLVGKNINVYANRGTSGIDGCTSTALGAAIASPHRQNVLITGDLAFVYDSNALWNKYNPDNLKIIVLNNGGGGIFSKLDAAHQPEFNDYFFTPNTAHIDSLCAGFGAHHTKFDGDNTGFQSVLEDFLQPKKNSTATSVLEIAVGNA
jgi:2-succinyl-5-enolpyruvyl-6-hydroxy-3-cyclohexene-1-carboxylate synthase